jgi:hypothetical protein
MRKDSVQALAAIRELGYVDDGHDASGHPILWHPGKDVRVKVSLSPSDVNAGRQALRRAHKLLGLPPPAAAGKRRPADQRRAAQRKGRNTATDQRIGRLRRDQVGPAEYERIRQANIAAAREHALRIRFERETQLADLNRTIRGLMAVLRSCSNPAGRAVVEAKIRPLVLRRQEIMRAA